MALIKILQYPDKRLKRQSVRVETFDDTIQKVIDDMFETRYTTESCAALAATQLDLEIPWSITVIDLSQNNDEPLCLVNPEIVSYEGEQFEYEGCMSVYPNFIQEKVKRAQIITVKAQDRFGEPFELKAEGYLAKCIQHEVDHLNGGLYIDRLPKIKLERISRRVKKQERMQKKGPGEK
ncbi:peptide deformylase [Candidatus Berkiella aquae]|uniref:Peptide deformylase n=1 Tax=Candidatus Berkiella aquae TaxID=295108 RepID=A0A0Q9YJK1_9GAMM|nr:peptide deformylase [Candidatus Berkiella aquae]MCS5711322.1 peptide deformylase [Candidatus Berkiella aquae]